MRGSIATDVAELVKAGIIPEETGDKIREYFGNRNSQAPNRLFIVFGILGALLTGLGLILIIAHNWDEFTIRTKSFFAFLPLIAGQIFCVFSLTKKHENITWKESGAAFLFFSIGASISLVSQIYNIPGNVSAFLLTWMLLAFPLLYVLKSSMASLLYLIGITYYAAEAGYWTYPSSETYFYWVLLLLALPRYYLLYKKDSVSNFMIFHNWIVPLSITIALGTVASTTEEFMFVSYISLFGLFFLIGNTTFFKHQKLRNNGYFIIGSLGTLILLLILSFDWFWRNLRSEDFRINEVIRSPELIAAIIISLAAAALLYFKNKNRPFVNIHPFEVVFLLFIIIFAIGLSSSMAAILVNFLVLSLGVLTIRKGAKHDHLGILNYGLLMITALIVCRFFDTDLSFVVRGIVFITVGIGFILLNSWMLRKRKENA